MRVNVYAEELTEDVALVTTEVVGTGKTYHGIRFFLASSAKLHYSNADDDRSAVTLWGDPKKLRSLMRVAIEQLHDGAVAHDEWELQLRNSGGD